MMAKLLANYQAYLVNTGYMGVAQTQITANC